jgi:putative oxidoreductase
MAVKDDSSRVGVALLILRVTVFVVMLAWTIDKFVEPQHTSKIMEHFYFIKGVSSSIIYIIGALELTVLIGFVAGFAKTWTYGLVLFFHAVSTLSSYKQYLHPLVAPNMLFFAAWPMLGACFTLYYLRDLDTFFTLGSPGRSGTH